MNDWLRKALRKLHRATSEALSFRWETEQAYFVKLHFSKEAFGKPVSRVVAAIGLLHEDEDGTRTISDREEMELHLGVEGFTTTKVVRSCVISGAPQIIGVVVRYRAFFEDGDSWYSEESCLSPQRSHLVLNRTDFQSTLAVLSRRVESGTPKESSCCDSVRFLRRAA